MSTTEQPEATGINMSVSKIVYKRLRCHTDNVTIYDSIEDLLTYTIHVTGNQARNRDSKRNHFQIVLDQ